MPLCGGTAVSTFYLLPPRPLLADCLAHFLQRFFPGLPWDVAARGRLVELLAGAAERGDVFVVHREDLPAGVPPQRALVDGFGAEAGDEVVEVRVGPERGETVERRWRVEPSRET
jgi:hypothetical protein